MFHFLLHTKAGFSLTELMVVVVVLGILTAVAVPVFIGGYEKKKEEDCRNQMKVVEAAVKEGMFGMIDNGKRQEAINFRGPDGELLPHALTKSFPDKAGGPSAVPKARNVFELSPKNMFTLGELRGGYRPDPNEDYGESCDTYNNWYFLKKKRLEDVPFSNYLANADIPVCPFSKEGEPPIYYLILEDGTVYCPHCDK